jgi:hypothetical protein
VPAKKTVHVIQLNSGVVHVQATNLLTGAVSTTAQYDSLVFRSLGSNQWIRVQTAAQVSGLQPPAQAAAVGYTRLVFQEEFDDTSGIDLADTRQPGFNFYTEPPFGFPQLTEISISNSILRFTGPGGTANGSLYSTVGTTFPNWIGFGAVGGAYFEASIAIPNPNFPIPSPGWPSFWSMANEHLWGPLTGTFDGFLEIDFLEYIWGQNSQLYQSPLHWWGNPKHDYNPNIDPPGTVNYTQFHRYGCLRVPGSRIDAYFGDVLVQSATYAALPWLAGGDSQSMPVILGCDLMEMQVDWVRVWQAP